MKNSLGVGSALGEKEEEKNGGRRSASEASRAVLWGEKKVRCPFTLPSPRFSSLRFFAFSPNTEPGTRLYEELNINQIPSGSNNHNNVFVDFWGQNIKTWKTLAQLFQFSIHVHPCHLYDVATDDRKQFEYLNIVLNNKTVPSMSTGSLESNGTSEEVVLFFRTKCSKQKINSRSISSKPPFLPVLGLQWCFSVNETDLDKWYINLIFLIFKR